MRIFYAPEKVNHFLLQEDGTSEHISAEFAKSLKYPNLQSTVKHGHPSSEWAKLIAARSYVEDVVDILKKEKTIPESYRSTLEALSNLGKKFASKKVTYIRIANEFRDAAKNGNLTINENVSQWPRVLKVVKRRSRTGFAKFVDAVGGNPNVALLMI